MLNVRVTEEEREDEGHDDHHEERVEHAPDDAEDAATVLELEVLCDKLAENEEVSLAGGIPRVARRGCMRGGLWGGRLLWGRGHVLLSRLDV